MELLHVSLVVLRWLMSYKYFHNLVHYGVSSDAIFVGWFCFVVNIIDE